MDYRSVHRRSIEDRAGFWGEEAARIEWQAPFTEVLDYSRPPFARWFVGGTTNLCHNAIDRWLPTQADARALVFVSTETNEERIYTFAELHREVQRMAATMLALGVGRGDRVLIYMPMIPEATFAMLACARIGDPLRGVRGLRVGQPRQPHRGRLAHADRQRRRRLARRQGRALQAPAG